MDELAGEALPELERIAVFTDQPVTAWATQTLPRALFDILPISELPNRQHLQANHFVVFDGNDAPKDNFLLSLWLDAEENIVVVPEGAETFDLEPKNGTLVSNCLYPLNGDQTQFQPRRAATL